MAALKNKDSKFNKLIVVLNKDMSEAEMQPLVNAILLLKDVSLVTVESEPVSVQELIARARAKEALRNKIAGLLYDK